MTNARSPSTRRLISGIVAVAGCLFLTTAPAGAATAPLNAGTGPHGGLLRSSAFAVAFSVPATFTPYVTINGTPEAGAYGDRLTVAPDKACQLVVEVSGRIQNTRPTTTSLAGDGFKRSSSRHHGHRHWAQGRSQDGSVLAVSWRTATPATRPLGRYLAVFARASTQSVPAWPECAAPLSSAGRITTSIAETWAITRR
jgi:hypothetical protein